MAGDPAKIKKIKKRSKNFVWKLKWIPIPNSVPDSHPVFIRKWVKIKVEVTNESKDDLSDDKVDDKKLNGNIRDIAAQIIDRNNEERKGNDER